MISIIVDDRESRSGIVEALSRKENVEVTVQRLQLGDYQVNDKLLFERKTLADLAVSIIDGRLFTQASRLAQSQLHSVVVIEGTGADLSAMGVSREAIQGALIAVTVIFGIPLLRSRDIQETANLVVYTAQQVNTMVSGAVARKGRRPKSKRKTQLYILQGLPGIGPVRAARLLDKFGSVAAAVNANQNELKAIEGVGVETAKAIHWALHQPQAEYRIS